MRENDVIPQNSSESQARSISPALFISVPGVKLPAGENSRPRLYAQAQPDGTCPVGGQRELARPHQLITMSGVSVWPPFSLPFHGQDPSNLVHCVHCVMSPPCTVSNAELGTRAIHQDRPREPGQGRCRAAAGVGWETRLRVPALTQTNSVT